MMQKNAIFYKEIQSSSFDAGLFLGVELKSINF